MPEPRAPDFYIEALRPHLGGYIRGGDPATYFPALWDWLVLARGVQSVVDVGCGEGCALDHFRGLGCRVFGVDGIYQDDGDIEQHDYTTGPLPRIPGGFFDLAWSCEFVEHVEERFVPNFLDTFKAARMVLMTHAEPGQPGHHHVNCQPADYWIGAMAAVGLAFDAVLTHQARERAALNPNPINHFARSGLAFVRA